MYEKITKQALKTKKTKEKIISTALKLMRERGYDNTSIRDICESAKVTTGSFYNLFDSKEELLNIVFESTKNYFDNYQINPKKDSVEKIVDEYIRMIKEMLGLEEWDGFVVFYQIAFLPKDGNKLLYNDSHPAKIFLVNEINEFKKIGKIKNDVDIEYIADLLINALIGAMYYTRIKNDKEICCKVLEDTCYPIIKSIKK